MATEERIRTLKRKRFDIDQELKQLQKDTLIHRISFGFGDTYNDRGINSEDEKHVLCNYSHQDVRRAYDRASELMGFSFTGAKGWLRKFDDCVLGPDRIERLLAAMKKYSAPFCLHDFETAEYDKDGKVICLRQPLDEEVLLIIQWMVSTQLPDVDFELEASFPWFATRLNFGSHWTRVKD